MPDLVPLPLPVLARRMLRELEERDAVFDLPRTKFFLGDAEHDLSVRFHGRRAASPFGPAAGPQSQMAQNLVLAWLAGARIVELKTVQILDELVIPRPCIDARTIGYNVEWSQELKLEESRREYVKGAMLVEILKASGALDVVPGFDDTIWDMSVGYDLAGLRSERVRDYLRGMMDARADVEALRAELRGPLSRWADLEFPTRLSRTLTLSTFHGCPPDEIERILDHLMREYGLDVVVKLNPTLLGPDVARGLLADGLGYTDLRIPDSAFANDTKWEQSVEFVERLGETATALGVGFGVKFTNTLIVENRGDFLPATEKESYLSGQPLHVLAMHLVRRFRRRFGDRFPVSFSAGIDRANFAEAVALGLVPVTVCTDLLRPGGYARGGSYLEALAQHLAAVGARSVEEWIVRAFGHGAAALDRATEADSPARAAGTAALAAHGDLRAAVGEELFARWVTEAKLLNTETWVERVDGDPRYSAARNAKPPRKVGTHLVLLDCLTCDKCLPVCPNDANFLVRIAAGAIPSGRLRLVDGSWVLAEEPPLAVGKKHQIGNFVDFCNECGNCDVFCPEDGGPYVMKARFHGRLDAFEADVTGDAFWVSRTADGSEVRARHGGAAYRLVRRDGSARIRYEGPGFALDLDLADPTATASGEAVGEVDLTWAHLLARYGDAVLDDPAGNWVGALND